MSLVGGAKSSRILRHDNGITITNDLATFYPFPIASDPTFRYLVPLLLKFVVLLWEPGSPTTPQSALFLLHYSQVNLYWYFCHTLLAQVFRPLHLRVVSCLSRTSQKKYLLGLHYCVQVKWVRVPLEWPFIPRQSRLTFSDENATKYNLYVNGVKVINGVRVSHHI